MAPGGPVGSTQWPALDPADRGFQWSEPGGPTGVHPRDAAGQVTLGGIQRGALRSGWVGYWVDSTFHGKGVATAAVALTVAHGFGPVGLHRIEATIAPENLASRAVVSHLGFRQEGHLVRYLDIAGGWRDHLLYALTAEEAPHGLPQLLQRWQDGGPSRPGDRLPPR